MATLLGASNLLNWMIFLVETTEDGASDSNFIKNPLDRANKNVSRAGWFVYNRNTNAIIFYKRLREKLLHELLLMQVEISCLNE